MIVRTSPNPHDETLRVGEPVETHLVVLVDRPVGAMLVAVVFHHDPSRFVEEVDPTCPFAPVVVHVDVEFWFG